MSPWRAPLWRRGFRPFFLLTGLYGGVSVVAWLFLLAGLAPAPAWIGPTLWHGHEMLFGVVCAAVAGFLLTAVPVWTSTPAVAGGPLAGLAALWVAGRVVLFGAGALPPWLVAGVDLAFLPALAAALARRLLTKGQARNWGFLPILVVLFGCNLGMHARAMDVTTADPSSALRLGVDLVVILLVTIGGRITPSFTANALQRAGVPPSVRSRSWIDRTAIAAVVLVAALDVALPRTIWSGGAALLAAVAVTGRMLGWRSLRTGHDPLLWSLHVGAAWIPLGLVLVSIGDLTRAIPSSAGLHALTAGAMGATILAVMTRVGLGHTGRPLVAPRGAAASYGLVSAGALVRTFGPVAWPEQPLPSFVVAGVLWAAGFGVFSLVYWPILTSARVDDLAG